MTRAVVRAFLAAAALLVVAPAAFGQEGQVAGTVRDASGGVMPGAHTRSLSGSRSSALSEVNNWMNPMGLIASRFARLSVQFSF